MAIDDLDPAASTPNRGKTPGQKYESTAFTFCKAATLILLTQRYALPVAAGGAAVFYLLADLHGQKETRCVLRVPRLIATFWGVIAMISLYLIVRPVHGH